MLTLLKDKLATHVNTAIQSLYGKTGSFSDLIELPKSAAHGDLALPVFILAKELKKAPPAIAKEICDKLSEMKIPEIKQTQPLAGFVNVFFDEGYLQKVLLDSISKSDNAMQLGFSKRYAGQTLIIDFSSPNVAKPMHVGHLRATVIGQAIRNLAETQGFNVIGINHLGDWGTQFGKLAWAYTNWGSNYDNPNTMDALLDMYVKFHEQAEKDPELEKKGAAYFLRLESGDPEIKAIWEKIREISLKDYERVYNLLGVKHELVQGEAFYNDQLESTVEKIKKAGILEESQGAQVVFTEPEKPPCIIKKSDGASLYATRDIASAIYRHEVLKGDTILYVVGSEQSLHFQQVFAVLNKMNLPWAKNCHHIAFGLYRFKEGKMSTRKGQIIRAEDVLNMAIQEASKIIEEKNPELLDKQRVAKTVAVGAVVFHDLLNDRIKNIEFDFDKILDFEGDSGPYVQYCVVRCKSVIRKFQDQFSRTPKLEMPVELRENEERALALRILSLDDAFAAAFRQFKPNILASYLLDLCRDFNHFYHKHKILACEDEKIRLSRLALVMATQMVLEKGLAVLGISAPEQM